MPIMVSEMDENGKIRKPQGSIKKEVFVLKQTKMALNLLYKDLSNLGHHMIISEIFEGEVRLIYMSGLCIFRVLFAME